MNSDKLKKLVIGPSLILLRFGLDSIFIVVPVLLFIYFFPSLWKCTACEFFFLHSFLLVGG